MFHSVFLDRPFYQYRVVPSARGHYRPGVTSGTEFKWDWGGGDLYFIWGYPPATPKLKSGSIGGAKAGLDRCMPLVCCSCLTDSGQQGELVTLTLVSQLVHSTRQLRGTDAWSVGNVETIPQTAQLAGPALSTVNCFTAPYFHLPS